MWYRECRIGLWYDVGVGSVFILCGVIHLGGFLPLARFQLRSEKGCG
jgi:hypothetical protein